MYATQSANHSAKRWKMDLQMFAGDEDAIFPDDYVAPGAAPPQADETKESQEPPAEPVSETTPPAQQPPVDPQQPPAADTPKIKVKYNHEEKELGIDEAVPLIQKGMNYDKLQEKLTGLENDPGRQFLEKLAKNHNMSVPQYLEAVRLQEERDQINELVQKNIPTELAQEILEARKDREERQRKEAEQSEKDKQDADLAEFLEYFQQVNDRPYDAKKDTIPKDVWDIVKQGTPLRFAYIEHQNKQLTSQLKISKQNEENQQRAPVGSLTAHGSTESAPEDPFLKGFNSI